MTESEKCDRWYNSNQFKRINYEILISKQSNRADSAIILFESHRGKLLENN